MTTIYRQGDVLLVQVSQIPAGAKQSTQKGDLVLAYGEVTGHAHRIRDTKKARLWDAGAERYLQVLETVSLTHEEHSTVSIPPGAYIVPTQIEYSPAALRRVAD